MAGIFGHGVVRSSQSWRMQMVDVGCGIGGSSRHIAKKFGCRAEGITLSPVQVLTKSNVVPNTYSVAA